MVEVLCCPNKGCPIVKLPKGSMFCGECGSKGEEFGVGKITELIKGKNMNKRVERGIEQGDDEILVSENMSDEEIRGKIYGDMIHLAESERGTGWMRAGTLLSRDPVQQMLGAGFKALINQNKIVIRQNELILRALGKRDKFGG